MITDCARRLFISLAFIFSFVVFIPSNVLAATISYLITEGVVAYQVSVKGEVFLEKNLTIEYKGGQVIFSSNPDGTGATYADDAVVMTFKKQGSSTIKTFKHEYESSCRNLQALPPKDLTSNFSGEGTYEINVKIKDECGYWAASSAMYLVNIGAPEPTPIAPEPFLDLPFKHDGKKFDEVATNINSYFDHAYPLLSSGVGEPAALSGQIITYANEISESKSYSSHDGYDYGSWAGVNDGDPVLAAASGSATYKIGGASGNMILIDHGNGFQTRYMHMYLDGMIASPSGKQKVWVEKGQQIGKVGHTGNCYSLDRFGNKIYNTADCAHIHFDVTRDKEWKNGDGDFSDNIPDGMTDPFGWEVTKDEADKSIDPWEHYSFYYNGKQRTGTKSYYLWAKKFPGIVDTVTETGGTYTIGDFKAVVKPDTFFSSVTLYMNYAPSVIATESVRSVGPVIDIKVKNILGDFVTLLTKPVDLIWYPFKNTDLSRFKIGSFYVYSSKDGNTWTKEIEVNPFNPGEITAAVSHLTYFAIMGERKDITAPITTPEIEGLRGQENLYKSEVELKFIATDSADIDPAGVKYTYYKINDDEWALYEDKPISLSQEKKYVVSFYSSDNDGNIGDLKTIEFDIDKTSPVVTAIPDREPDVSGWYNKPVKIDFKSEEDTDICESVSYEGPDMENAVIEGTCTDKAGNEGRAEYILNYDSSKPNLILNALSNGEEYASGMWTNSGVNIEFICSDHVSGVDQYSDPILLSNEGKDQSVTGTCSDNAGNDVTVEFKNINIDKTAPVVILRATPDEIWPPNGKMVDILIAGNIIEDNLKTKTFKVIDEYGLIQPNITDFDQTIQLESKREGKDKDGRFYEIRVFVEDLAGNIAEAQAIVVVPHDQSK